MEILVSLPVLCFVVATMFCALWLVQLCTVIRRRDNA
jgi:hypothetical protein